MERRTCTGSIFGTHCPEKLAQNKNAPGIPGAVVHCIPASAGQQVYFFFFAGAFFAAFFAAFLVAFFIE